MSNNTQKNTEALLKAQVEAQAKEIAELKKALESKPVKAAAVKVTADDTTLKAREITKIVKLNVSKEEAKKIIGFNGTFNEGVGKAIGFYSNRNDKCGDDRASQERYWIAKAIDTSGFYLHPVEGIVYCSININKAGMRTIYRIDRQAKAEVKAYLSTIADKTC